MSVVREDRELVLHVGTGKAGSSSVQAFLRDNRDRLAGHGVLYPRSPGRGRHVRLGLLVKSPAERERSPAWERVGVPDHADFERSLQRRLLREVEQSGLPRVLLSDEVLFVRDEAELGRLRGLATALAGRLRVVVYLRRQDEHLVSRYQQGIKTGLVQRLEDYAREDHSALYDYAARLSVLGRVLEPDALVVRRFEPDGFPGGSLHQDFLDAAGVEAAAASWAQVPRRNESLDAESVEFLRLLNVHLVEQEGARVGLINRGDMVARLTEASTGPVLSLPGPDLDALMDRWAASNRTVATDLLGEPDGVLFRAPRRERRVVTLQRLEPERVDHFLQVAEVPERLHRPLRRIAGREAGAARR